jgi:hypothetical protein
MGRSDMSGSDGGEQKKAGEQKKEEKDNVVSLGTEALFAIAEGLRQMYDADLQSRPSERLERLLRKIENSEDPWHKPEPPA